MSKQAWEIVSKIREVDEVLREIPPLQWVIREIHPEVSFFFLAGERRLAHGKKSKEGHALRKELLRPHFDQAIEDAGNALAHRAELMSQPDDILDALAALWSAERILRGSARTLAKALIRYPLGLRMEISA